MENTIRCKLIAEKDGIYKTMVFQNLDNYEYLMCTRLPNWDCENLDIGSEGFLCYEFVKAGESYFDSKENKYIKYLYTNIYFKNFIKDNSKQQEILIV